MKKIIIVSLVLLSSLFYGCGNNNTAKQPEQQIPLEQPEKQSVNFTFNFDEGNQKSFTINQEKDDTVYSLMQKLAEDGSISLEVKEYDFGVMIDSIDNIRNGTDNKYWIYYINGQMAGEGVSTQKVQNNDNIEFRFEKSNF